jgi:arsenate reductase
MFKVFGIPNCDTVKKARTFLESKNIPYEFVDFKKHTPTKEEVARWSDAFGGLPVNTKGVTYKKHKDVFESLTPAKKIAFIQENTSMIKRPILEKNGKVIAFGFSEEEYKGISGK